LFTTFKVLELSQITLDPIAYPPVGRWLKAQRDVLGLSIAVASDIAQMSEKTLHLLELEQFLSLPEPIFVKGYLRRYANALKLNPVEVIALYDAWLETYSLKNELQHREVTPQATMTAPIAWVSQVKEQLDNILHYTHTKVGQAVLASCFIGAFAFFLSAGSNANQPERMAQATTSNPANLASDSSYRVESKLSEKTLSTATRVRAAAKKSNFLVASSTTHVQVIDASGLIVYNGLVKPSKRVQINGKTPFKLNAERFNTVRIISSNDSSPELYIATNS
jgi:cytoskeletal protein RodZ